MQEERRAITQRVKNFDYNSPEPEDVKLLNRIAQCVTADRDDVPQPWVSWVDRRYIAPLWQPDFWSTVASKECFMQSKARRRFFPMRGNAEWQALSRSVYKSTYPEFEAFERHNNFDKGNNIKLHTNYGMIPRVDTARIAAEVATTRRVIELVMQLGDADLMRKLWYVLATNYDMCHIPIKDAVGLQLTRAIWRTDRDLVIAGLFWSMYILAHEEATAHDAHTITETDRFVFTLAEMCQLDFLEGLPVDQSPWIINAMRDGNNVYNCAPFFLAGARSIATPDQVRERLNHITHGCFAGFERFRDAGLSGSVLMQCLSNNELLRAADEPDGGALDTSIAAFRRRQQLYFPHEGEMASDIDVVISNRSFKGAIATANEMVALINQNMGSPCKVRFDCTASGVRYHVSHAELPFKIEIFRSPQPRMQLVSGFHVAPVRAYWNFDPDVANNIYMTRTAGASIVTGIGENFYWFSSNKVPPDVILKYAQRGVTTVLNIKELECLSEYLKSSELWGYGFHKIDEFTGSMQWSHPFFRVDALPLGIRWGLPRQPVATGNFRHNVYRLAPRLQWRGTDCSRRYQEVEHLCRVAAPPQLFTA